MIYSLVFLLQLLAFGLYMAVFTQFTPPVTFLYATGIFLVSIAMFFVGIVRSKHATPLNCFTVLLFLMNMMMIVLFLFTGYLNSFLTHFKQ
jgi:hypothetical protein